MVHDPDHLFDGRGSLGHVRDFLVEVEVDDVVAVVGHGRRLPGLGLVVGAVAQAQHGLAALELRQRRHDAQRVLVAEGRDFNRQRERRAEATAE